jgi:hypothetical protein
MSQTTTAKVPMAAYAEATRSGGPAYGYANATVTLPDP